MQSMRSPCHIIDIIISQQLRLDSPFQQTCPLTFNQEDAEFLHFSTHDFAESLHFSTHDFAEFLHFSTHDFAEFLHFSTHNFAESLHFSTHDFAKFLHVSTHDFAEFLHFSTHDFAKSIQINLPGGRHLAKPLLGRTIILACALLRYYHPDRQKLCSYNAAPTVIISRQGQSRAAFFRGLP